LVSRSQTCTNSVLHSFRLTFNESIGGLRYVNVGNALIGGSASCTGPCASVGWAPVADIARVWFWCWGVWYIYPYVEFLQTRETLDNSYSQGGEATYLLLGPKPLIILKLLSLGVYL
jgi:hypothetical protein